MAQETDDPAIAAARAAQAKVHACLDNGESFRLEAGAGAGKTYSLVAALKKIIAERGTSLMQIGQRVACITYTEVARKEIAQDIEEHPAILVQTIHAFSWAFMAPFQPALRKLVAGLEDRLEDIEAGGGVGQKEVVYDLGFFRVGEHQVSLRHDDVPVFMAKLLAQEKFKRLLAQQFPIVFIDEYQDTDRDFMASLDQHVFQSTGGPLVGLFGDHWQTIYRSEYELTNYAVEGIEKGSNFRSAKPIVDVLNQLRPELPQVVSDAYAPGEARFFHSNAYTGDRTSTAHSKNDLPPYLAKSTRENLMARLQQDGWDPAVTKVLMLTHSVLAAEQGYPGIVSVFAGRNDQFARKEDPALKLFAEVVEPMCAAYEAENYGEMFEAYGKGPTIRSHADKLSWRTDIDDLLELRQSGTIGDVIDHLKRTHRPPLSSRLAKREEELLALAGAHPTDEMGSLQRHQGLRLVPYKEVIEVVRFVEGFTPFATQHSVKGAEFENVLVVLGGGWNHYNWPQLFELLETKALTDKNTGGFYRSRNLFYVSISRSMKRLAVLATQTMSATALKSITRLFGTKLVVEIPLESIG